MKRIALVALAGFLLVAVPASAKTAWLCKPGMKNNPCEPSLETTLFTSLDGPSSVYTPTPARSVDCFYVYPTVSNQLRTLTTTAPDPEIKSQALYHAARFSEVCRVFVPLYRQVTVNGLNRRQQITSRDRSAGSVDIARAWKEYLAKYNGGRGVVLIGHSQGTGRLIALMQTYIDRDPAMRSKLVSALLLGGSVTVQAGSDRGGSFENVPACRAPDQTGCVVAYSMFNETPPENSFFARAAKPSQQSLCTNPAALQGGPAQLDSIFPSTPFAQGYIGAGWTLVRFPRPQVATPWLEATAALSGECVTEAGATFLRLTALPGSPTPHATPTPGWGLHLLDVNAALGDLVKLVKSQSAAYARG